MRKSNRFCAPLAGCMVLAGLLLGGCATSKNIPMKIQSYPLGAHVLYQERSRVNGSSNDWIYLGATPLEINRSIRTKQLKKADAFVLRLIHRGYVDQTKEWSGDRLKAEVKEKGFVFWNPRLVPKQE